MDFPDLTRRRKRRSPSPGYDYETIRDFIRYETIRYGRTRILFHSGGPNVSTIKLRVVLGIFYRSVSIFDLSKSISSTHNAQRTTHNAQRSMATATAKGQIQQVHQSTGPPGEAMILPPLILHLASWYLELVLSRENRAPSTSRLCCTEN
jgi:hypothetical protein